MTTPFDLDTVRQPAWLTHWMPIGEGERFDKESVDDWWARLKPELGHLPRTLCEQWIHRHWLNSRFSYIPLLDLQWRLETLGGDALLARLHRYYGGELEPRYDYEAYQRGGGDDRHPTAQALDTGTWDYPLIVMETPYGVIDGGETLVDTRWVIVEGHSRHRYLNAMHALGQPPCGPHDVYVLTTPLVENEFA